MSVRLTFSSRDLMSYMCNPCGREWTQHAYNLRPEPVNHEDGPGKNKTR